MSDRTNMVRIAAVYNALEELSNNVVFVGGATVSLYKDRPASETRVTDDVDIVVELASYSGFAAIEDQLRKKGFVNDADSHIICRYKINGIIVDVMPTEENILGFNNQWYPEGFRNAIEYTLPGNEKIKIFSSVYFLASKFDAFCDRGNHDGRTSSDFEDIVFLLNNRNNIWNELNVAPEPVKQYLKLEFSQLLRHDYIYEWISAHLDFGEQKRVSFIIAGLTAFIGLSESNTHAI